MSEMTMELEKKEATTPAETELVRPRRTFIPRIDIYFAGDEIVLVADMPGVDEHNVDVTLEKNLLTIRGRVVNQAPEGYKSVYSEYRIGDYERTFSLSDEVDRDKIEAVLANGVLRLTLTKYEAIKARKIAVHAEM